MPTAYCIAGMGKQHAACCMATGPMSAAAMPAACQPGVCHAGSISIHNAWVTYHIHGVETILCCCHAGSIPNAG